MRCFPRAGALRRPLFLCLLLATPAAAQLPGLRVERRGPDPVAVSPGAAATVVFRVVNAGAASARAPVRAELPPGWRLLAGDGAVELAPGEAEARLVGFVVPAGAAAGSYRVRFGAAGSAGAGDSVAVRVLERRRLELRLAEAPELAAAGDAYTSTFLLANRGNVATRVRLRVVSGAGLAAQADTAPLALAPGEERPVHVRVLTPRSLDRELRHALELRAADAADGAPAVAAGSRVQVVPRPAPAPRFHRFPVAVTLRAASAGAGGIPAEASGSGALLPGGRLRLDFLARGGADAFSGQRPEFRAVLSGRGGELRAGDHLWMHSRLAGGMRPGRGVGGSLAAGRWSAAAFARRGGPGAPDEREEAASLALRVGGGASLEAGAFRRSGAAAGAGWTLRAASTALPWARVEAEYGLGARRDGAGDARSLLLHGGGARFSYSLRHLRVGEGFPWRDGPTRQDFASLALRPAGPLRVDASLDRRAGGSLDVPGAPADDGWSLRAGAAYGGAVAVRLERRDAAEAARFAGVLRSGEVRLGLGRGALRLHPLLRAGAVAGPAGELPFRGAGLQAALAGRGGSLSARVDRVDGAVPGRPGARGATEAALDGSARLGAAGELRASLRAVRPGGAGWSELLFDAGAERRLPGGHRIAAGVRLAGAGAGAALRNLFRLDYTVPVGVPVARGGEGGRVVGRVYDAETGAPLAGALVTLAGRTVLTDAAGRLAFGGLPAGSYRLRVEGRGPGAGRVPLDDAPVVLRPGAREVRVEVGMTRRARLRGVVRLVAGADSSGVAGVALELSRGDETLRRVSGADGGFDFTDLRPGRWTLSVVAAPLPPHHRFEREAVELELAQGEARELALRVLPVRRPVRMITGGEVVVEAPRPGGRRP